MTTPVAAPALVRLGRVESTQAVAFTLAADGAADRTVVIAEAQSAGRGRRGRTWHDEPGASLLTSIILRPHLAPTRLPMLSLVAGIAVAEALERVAGLAPRLKWPNDVLVDGRKLAGILLEASAGGSGAIDHLVVGVGVNVAAHPDDLPYPATDLVACGGTADAATVLAAFADRFLPLYRTWEGEGFASIRAAWLDRAEGYGGPVTVRLDRATLEGRFAALDGQGALLLETADGGRRSITAGDLFFAAHG